MVYNCLLDQRLSLQNGKFQIFVGNWKILSLQGGRILQINLTTAIYTPWGNVFHEKIISIIRSKYYATYNIARNMIQYEQRSLYYALKLKQAPVIWRFTIRKATLRKAGYSLRLVRNFSVWCKFNYLCTYRVHQDCFILSQFFFLPSRFLQSFYGCCSFMILFKMSWKIVLRHVRGDKLCRFCLCCISILWHFFSPQYQLPKLLRGFWWQKHTELFFTWEFLQRSLWKKGTKLEFI